MTRRMTGAERALMLSVARLRREDGRHRYPLTYVAALLGVTVTTVSSALMRTGEARGRAARPETSTVGGGRSK